MSDESLEIVGLAGSIIALFLAFLIISYISKGSVFA
jgi:hypothetical protein